MTGEQIQLVGARVFGVLASLGVAWLAFVAFSFSLWPQPEDSAALQAAALPLIWSATFGVLAVFLLLVTFRIPQLWLAVVGAVPAAVQAWLLLL